MKTKFYFSRSQRAFTLIELMIVIAIIAILATVAIPSYTSYTQKAALSELLQASSSYKSDVEVCIYNTGAAANCSAGQNGIQANRSESNDTKYLKTVSVASGVISVEGKGNLDGYGYSLTPTLNNGIISWATSCKGSDQSLYPANFCTVSN